MKMSLASQLRAAFLSGVEPAVTVGTERVEVHIVTFTKWGGFFREVYTLTPGTSTTIKDVQRTNVVPYQCGIMF